MKNSKPPKAIPKIKKPKLKIKGLVNQYLVEVLYFSFLGLLLFLCLKYFSSQEYASKNYFYLQIVSLASGVFHAFGFIHWISWADKYKGTVELIVSLLILFVGVGFIYFSSVLSFIPSLPIQYAWAFLMFLVPWFFMLCFEYFINIPDKYYRGWQYPYGKEVPIIEVMDPVKINFYVAKRQEDEDYAQFALNVPQKYTLGDFMHYFMHRYNYDKNPESPIYISKDNKNSDLYDWLFYARGKNMNQKKVLDPSKTFEELSLGENSNIVLDRYASMDELSVDVPEEPIDSIIEINEINE